AKIDLPLLVLIALTDILRFGVPGELDLLHCPRQHPGYHIGVSDGRTLPESDVVVAEPAQEDAARHVMKHLRPILLLLEVGETLVQVETDARPEPLLELPQLLNPTPLRVRIGPLRADHQCKTNQ